MPRRCRGSVLPARAGRPPACAGTGRRPWRPRARSSLRRGASVSARACAPRTAAGWASPPVADHVVRPSCGDPHGGPSSRAHARRTCGRPADQRVSLQVRGWCSRTGSPTRRPSAEAHAQKPGRGARSEQASHRPMFGAAPHRRPPRRASGGARACAPPRAPPPRGTPARSARAAARHVARPLKSCGPGRPGCRSPGARP